MFIEQFYPIIYFYYGRTSKYTSVNKSSSSVPQSDGCALCSSRRNFGDLHPFIKEKLCCPASLETEILSMLFLSSSRTGDRMLIKISVLFVLPLLITQVIFLMRVCYKSIF